MEMTVKTEKSFLYRFRQADGRLLAFWGFVLPAFPAVLFVLLAVISLTTHWISNIDVYILAVAAVSPVCYVIGLFLSVSGMRRHGAGPAALAGTAVNILLLLTAAWLSPYFAMDYMLFN